MTVSIFANPGQTVTLAVQMLDSNGTRNDGYQGPTVESIILPSGSQAAGYPQNMVKLSTGLYKLSVTIPSGPTAIGTYLASVSWPHPSVGFVQNELFIINVALPFGNSSVVAA